MAKPPLTGPRIFLSASIPIRGHAPYDRDVRVTAIRNAVLALVAVCKDRDMELVFGGHPAISPLMHHAAASLGVLRNICIYQSRFFEDRMPVEAKQFPWLAWTEGRGDQAASENAMRESMLDPRRWHYDFAFFIGGMKGVLTEARMFYKRFPRAAMIPLRETGGAARLMEWSAEPDGENTFPLKIIKPQDEQEATTPLRYRRLLTECIEAATPFSGGHSIQP
jgi:hypothetical protein